MKNNKLKIGEYYPSEVLRDSKTGQPIMLQYTENTEEIRRMAKESGERLIKALSDPTGLTLI